MGLNARLFEIHVTGLTVMCLIMAPYLWLFFRTEACPLLVISTGGHKEESVGVNFSVNSNCNLQTGLTTGLLLLREVISLNDVLSLLCLLSVPNQKVPLI
jgi:hypothetical protein